MNPTLKTLFEPTTIMGVAGAACKIYSNSSNLTWGAIGQAVFIAALGYLAKSHPILGERPEIPTTPVATK